MNQLLDRLREDFKDEDVRYGYVEAFLNAFVAAQIKALREEREMSQDELAKKIGTKQPGISRLENVNYSSWKVETLRKLARAFRVRLHVSFEEFGTLIPEVENFRKETLQRRKFECDPVFATSEEPRSPSETTTEDARRPLEALSAKDGNRPLEGAHPQQQERKGNAIQIDQIFAEFEHRKGPARENINAAELAARKPASSIGLGGVA